MTVAECLAKAQRQLLPSPDCKRDAHLLMERVLGFDRPLRVLDLGRALTQAQQDAYMALLGRRQAGEPTQYILGQAYFMGLCLHVDQRVLIPRQDTETLCELALHSIRRQGYQSVLDLCTGSGALAVALGRLSGARISASDLSQDALDVARQNAQANGVEVSFYRGDLLAALEDGARFDLIVSNPPYLSKADMQAIAPELRREPAMALLAGEDGLEIYRRIAGGAGRHINPKGRLYLEVGQGQARAVAAMFGEKTQLHLDLLGIERVVEVCF